MAVISIIAVLLLTTRSPGTQAENLSASDPFAHLGNASFALVAPHSVLVANGQFASLARERYDFRYADASNFTNVQNSTFIVIVVNGSNDAYAQLALKAINTTELDNALNYTKGAMISRDNVWERGQTVFLLIGYNASSLSSALSSFFVKGPVYAPRQFSARFVNESGKASGDPIMDAVLDGTYELSPHDSALPYPYSYYDNFAYLIYYAPVITSIVPGLEGNSSGVGLPLFAPICMPPPPPPGGGSSMCVGDYAAMPMLQVGSAPPLRPQWSYDTGDCDFFGIDDCIDAEGWSASGLNPQLPYREIPSIYFGVTFTGSPVPPSMDGTFGPVSDSLPITWWIYGPDSFGESTGGFQSSLSGVMNESETALLINAGVDMFSAPISETPVGNFTIYNATNSSSTYSCGSEICGMRFNYTIYALLNVSSTIPGNASVASPRGYSPKSQLNYSAVLEPMSLSTPKIVKTSAETYYFSYWSVYSELAGNQYYKRYNTSDITFQLIGPTQARAIYTTNTTATSGPGNVTIYSDYIPMFQFGSCSNNPANCTKYGVYYQIPNVSVSISIPGGKVVFSGATNATATAVTGKLAGGCYNVAVSKPGYNLFADPNPLCVNGATSLFLVDTDPYIFNITWPSSYPYALAPVNGTIPINVSVRYASTGASAGNSSRYLYAHTTSGIIEGYSSGRIVNGYSNLSSNGTADFLWEVGKTPGVYGINFTIGVGWPILSESYFMPVVAYSGNYLRTELNISLSNTTEYASPGESFTDNIIVRLCRMYLISNRTLPCVPLAPYAANMSLAYVNDRPAKSTYAFVPNPAAVNSKSLDGTTALHISLGNSVVSGLYVAHITATMSTANGVYNATVPLLMYVSKNGSASTTTTVTSTTSMTTTIPGGSGYGALNVTVLFNGAPADAAQVRAFSPGVQNYGGWYTGFNGEYNTGFIIVPGSYEVDATYDNITNSTNYLNVSAGRTTFVNIEIYGAVNTTTTSSSSTTTTTSITSTSSTSTTSSSTTTVQSSYYSCNVCYQIVIDGDSCPPSCPTSISCNKFGGFECT